MGWVGGGMEVVVRSEGQQGVNMDLKLKYGQYHTIIGQINTCPLTLTWPGWPESTSQADMMGGSSVTFPGTGQCLYSREAVVS